MPVVVFGNSSFASLAAYCLTHDSGFEVVAHTVDRAYVGDGLHDGLPVVAFDVLESSYPAGDVRLLIALGYKAINGLRRDRYLQAKARGYECISYVSSRASIWPDFRAGENCLIYEHAIIQPFARIGDNVVIRSGAHVSHHCRIDDHAFIGAGAAMGGNVHIMEQVFVGVGAVLRDGLTIAPRTLVNAGAVVMADTEADRIYVGNPARKIGPRALESTEG